MAGAPLIMGRVPREKSSLILFGYKRKENMCLASSAVSRSTAPPDGQLYVCIYGKDFLHSMCGNEGPLLFFR